MDKLTLHDPSDLKKEKHIAKAHIEEIEPIPADGTYRMTLTSGKVYDFSDLTDIVTIKNFLNEKPGTPVKNQDASSTGAASKATKG